MTIPASALPQKDSSAERRRTWLEGNRERYQYDHEVLSPLPMLKNLPAMENLSFRDQLARYLKTRSGMYGNQILSKIKSIFDPFDKVEDFADLLSILPKPAVTHTWKTDEAFAEQRLSGANPMKVRRLEHEDQLPFKSGSKLPSGEPISEAASEGRLYLADYSELAFIKGGRADGRQKVLPTPKALFYWQSSGGSGRLMPVAIQIRDDWPAYSPQEVSPLDWQIAKLCVQIADANHHESASHLCYTHFVMEGFAIATARQLADNHPIGLLLRPHFRYMLANNFLGRERLVNTGGIIDKLLAGTLEETLTLVSNAYQAWSVKENSFPNEIANRGMDDEDMLPHYPYRDDGKLLWEAIRRFVKRYVNIFYENGTDVQEDYELQGWAAELADPASGNVKDMANHIENRDQLVELATTIIFTCAPQHCAVNFSQYDYMTFVPNMPLAAYCPVPGQNEPKTEQTLMGLLPPEDQARTQVAFGWALTGYKPDRFAFYENGHFTNPQVLALVDEFQQRLIKIERTIDIRNADRAVAYNFMKPSEMINSLSV